MLELNKEILGSEIIYIVGINAATEPLLNYCNKYGPKEIQVVVEKMTVPPDRCGIIPSNFAHIRNSFSETEMLMDTHFCGVPVVRIDTIELNNTGSLFILTELENNERIINILEKIDDLKYRIIGRNQLNEICKSKANLFELHEQNWLLKEFAVSEIQSLKNTAKRMIKPTCYDFHFEFHLVEHCNLNCAGCTHFSPLAKEEYLSPEEFENDITRLSLLTNKRARFINLLGGEPLLHPNIAEMLDIARSGFPNSTIRVVTNGILIPKMEESFWYSCKRNQIEIGVTEYPIRTNYGAIRKMIETNDLRYISFSGEGPRDEMWKLSINEKGDSRPVENFMKCPRANACVFCSHGKLFTCATMANIYHYNNYFGTKYYWEPEDYVDIYKIDSCDEIFEYLSNPTPFCRYCSIDHREYGKKWKISEKTIEEWL